MTDDEVPKSGPAAGWRLKTQLVRAGGRRTEWKETSEPVFLTSGFIYDTAEEAEARFKNEAPGFTYSRFDNPTVGMFEARMCALEGTPKAIATATGMAAVHASLLSVLNAGDHVLAARALFGSCRWIVETLCPRYGIEVSLIDGTDLDAWKSGLKPNTKALFFESPSNPTLDLVDVAAVAALGRNHGAHVIVDNVFATPLLQKPRELGADIVVYSATKHIDGQGRCLGGIVLGDEDYIEETLRPFCRNTGPALSPFNAWVLLKGLETLDLRVRQQCESAAKIADHLARHPFVRRTLYPGHPSHPQAALAERQMAQGGTLVAFEIDGGKQHAFALCNALALIDISNNLGDAKSLVTHPATTTHMRLTEEARAELGISPGLVRLSVGLEDADDLIDDLDRALRAAQNA
ncbi:MAG: O-succinylhomoserine sulfhydrylase [Pseudomonadota bacterium]